MSEGGNSFRHAAERREGAGEEPWRGSVFMYILEVREGGLGILILKGIIHHSSFPS